MVLYQMKYSNNLVILLFVILIIPCLECIQGLEHRVGGDYSLWSIPENNDFYYNWSINQSFHIGDTLVFDFQSEFHNVIQVSKREYDACSSDNPFQEFMVGPATIPLVQDGVYYFICSFANYCSLGQKLSITVHRNRSSPTSSPTVPYYQTPAHVVGPPTVGSTTSVSLTSTRIPASSCSTCFVSRWGLILPYCTLFWYFNLFGS